jgi:dienelactone hydrolase
MLRFPLSALALGLSAVFTLACGSDDEGARPDTTGDAGDQMPPPDAEPPTPRLSQYAAPGELGRFPIGVVSMPLVDGSRPELSTLDAEDRRTLPTTIWYPAAEEARTARKAVRGELLPPPIYTLLANAGAPGVLDVETNSVIDARIASDGPFPLIVFSHGNGGLGVQSYFLTEFLASHGYIVVCPDHTGNALMTQLPGGVVVGQGGETDADGTPIYTTALADRVADVSFLVDALTDLDAGDPDGRFMGAVDLEHVGLTGHSFGGLTTLLGMDGDSRFDVGAPMAPAAPDRSTFSRPVMYFWATQDQTLPFAPVQANYDSLSGPRMLVSVTDAGHFSFSNGCPFGLGTNDGCGTGTRLETGETFTFLEDVRVHEITVFYQAALWGYYLKAVEAYAADLQADPFPEHVTIQRDGMP